MCCYRRIVFHIFAPILFLYHHCFNILTSNSVTFFPERRADIVTSLLLQLLFLYTHPPPASQSLPPHHPNPSPPTYLSAPFTTPLLTSSPLTSPLPHHPTLHHPYPSSPCPSPPHPSSLFTFTTTLHLPFLSPPRPSPLTLHLSACSQAAKVRGGGALWSASLGRAGPSL